MPPPTNFSFLFWDQIIGNRIRDGKKITKEEKDHSEVTEVKILSTCSADFLKTKQKIRSTFLNAVLSHSFLPKKEVDVTLRYISNGNS